MKPPPDNPHPFFIPFQVYAKDIYLTNTDAKLYFSPIISVAPCLRMGIPGTQ